MTLELVRVVTFHGYRSGPRILKLNLNKCYSLGSGERVRTCRDRDYIDIFFMIMIMIRIRISQLMIMIII